MAKFKMELPTEIMKDFDKIYGNAHDIFGKMTQAGAKVVYENIKKNVPPAIRNSDMMTCLHISEVYDTPTDGAVNTQVSFAGYFNNEEGVRTPAPLVANVFEYGRKGSPFPKQPFLRKSFTKAAIERAMIEEQRKASGGLLK